MAQLKTLIPQDIPTGHTLEEAAKLTDLARGGAVLELGAGAGFSTVILAQAAHRVVSVDSHEGTWDVFRQNLDRFGVAGAVDARRGRFEAVLPSLSSAGELFDGVFLDAPGDAGTVARDLALALPLVRPGGWVGFGGYEPGGGVAQVADRFGVVGVINGLAWGLVPGHVSSARTARTLAVVGLPFNADGSGYHRIYLPFRHLGLNSRHLYGAPEPGADRPDPSPENMADVDVLVLQRPAFAKGMRQFDRLAGHVARVYETDDDLLRASSHNLPEFAADPRSGDSVRYCLRRAEMVTVSTPYLAELYAPFNSNIRVLPNCVKARLLEEPRRRGPAGKVTVGWQGGVTHLIDLCAVQEPLLKVLAAHPGDVDVHIISGIDYSPLLRRECRFTPWQQDVGEYYRRCDFDIALAPLADAEFNRAKSHLKALDAAAMGIPVVASDMEPYRDFVRDGETGFLVKTAGEWVDRLELLIGDRELREQMGAKARELAGEWTIERNWRLWEAAYEAAAR